MRSAWSVPTVAWLMLTACMSRAEAPFAQEVSASKSANSEPANSERKLITTLDVDLLVEDAVDAMRAVKAKVAAQPEAYIAKEESSTTTGQRRYAVLTLRVPAKQADAFADGLADIGDVQRKSRDAEDVTEQYFDNDSHLRNLRVEEERLLKLMQTATGKLDDVLAVERELSRVRGEIEILQGRQRLLEHRVSLSTVTVTLTERRDFLPASTPPFLRSAAETLSSSFAAFLAFIRIVGLALVALLPWLPPVAAIVFGVLWWRRRRR